MQLAYNILIGLVLAGVVAVLLLGFGNMVRGGTGSTNRSQMLMRARVIAQAIALLLILGALFLFGRNAG